jgi:hypothetical protein
MVDAEPTADGNVLMTYRPGMAPLAKVLTAIERKISYGPLRKSHFATCPDGPQWRKRRG